MSARTAIRAAILSGLALGLASSAGATFAKPPHSDKCEPRADQYPEIPDVLYVQDGRVVGMPADSPKVTPESMPEGLLSVEIICWTDAEERFGLVVRRGIVLVLTRDGLAANMRVALSDYAENQAVYYGQHESFDVAQVSYAPRQWPAMEVAARVGEDYWFAEATHPAIDIRCLTHGSAGALGTRDESAICEPAPHSERGSTSLRPADGVGEKPRITGYVINGDTGEPLAGAQIFLAPEHGALTDDAGWFSLQTDGPLAGSLWVRLIGFYPGEREITLEEGQQVDALFALEPAVLRAHGGVRTQVDPQSLVREATACEPHAEASPDLPDVVFLRDGEALDPEAGEGAATAFRPEADVVYVDVLCWPAAEERFGVATRLRAVVLVTGRGLLEHLSEALLDVAIHQSRTHDHFGTYDGSYRPPQASAWPDMELRVHALPSVWYAEASHPHLDVQCATFGSSAVPEPSEVWQTCRPIAEAGAGQILARDVGWPSPYASWIRGTVLDLETGRPISAVQIFLAGTESGTLSGTDGRFAFQVDPGRQQVLAARTLGYDEVRAEVHVGTLDVLDTLVLLRTRKIDLGCVCVTVGRRTRLTIDTRRLPIAGPPDFSFLLADSSSP